MISSLFYLYTTKLRKIFQSILINPEEEWKKVREGSSKTNNAADTIDNDVFQQTNSTSDIPKILVSLRKLEARVAEIYNFCNKTKSIQIKGDKQLAELTETVQHIPTNSMISKKIERRRKK